jgi:HTH-type transcriptional regulator/antitoxin HigA
MSVTYQELIAETLPKVIESEDDYNRFHRRIGELMRLRKRTAPETDLFHLLSLLLQDYDRRHALPPEDSKPAERLQYLIKVSGTKSADLVSIFGQISHVSEALSGKRPISVTQARKLGSMFHLKPGYFV